jgi:hypothetical protein
MFISNCMRTNNSPSSDTPLLAAGLFIVEFYTTNTILPEGYVLMGDQVLKYHKESNNIYYGDQAWAQNGLITAVDRGVGDALFDGFLFDNKTKTLKKIDTQSKDSFADDFNRCYGGNPGLCVDKHGNLTLNGDILIGTENSRIKTLYLPELTSMGDFSLNNASALTHFEACALATMGNGCLYNVCDLKHFEAPVLTSMGYLCLYDASALMHFESTVLTSMGNSCLCNVNTLKCFYAPVLTTMGDFCLSNANTLKRLYAPKLIAMGKFCLRNVCGLRHFEAQSLSTMGNGCFFNARTSVKNQSLPRLAVSALQALGM